MALFILLTSKKVIPCVLFCLELLYLHDFQARKYYLNYCSPITVFPCYLIFLMSDVQDFGCLRCRTLGMWNVWDARCLGCVICDAQNVGCLGWGMFKMWDVRDGGCSGCGMFGMWNV